MPFFLLLIGVLWAPLGLAAQSPKATRWEASCAAGNAADCHELAKAYRDGREKLVKDANAVAKYYRRACDLDRPVACQEFGEISLKGEYGVALDTAIAMDLLRRACWDDPEGRPGKTVGLVGGRRSCATIIDVYQVRPARDRADSVDRKQVTARACRRGKIDVACQLIGGGWALWPDSVGLDDSTKKRLASEAEALRAAELARADSLARAREDSLNRAKVRAPQPDPDGRSRRTEATAAELARRRTSLRMNCASGEALACMRYSEMVRRAQGGKADAAEADRARQKACELDKTLRGCQAG